MADEPDTRAELCAPYLHPYRRFVPVIWKDAHLHQIGLGTAGIVVATTGAALATGTTAWLVLGVLPALFALAVFLRVTLEAALVVHRFSRPWDDESELGAVREARPHAGEAHPVIVHREYAVTVEDSGHLFIWRYTPLLVMENAPPDTILVPGRPRYAATVAEQRDLDVDPARAAEQLADAQARAAALEAADIDRAHEHSLETERRRELAQETSSTAAALKHLTGQRRE